MRRSRGRNLRKGRISEPGRIYLVTACTHGRLPLFDSAPRARIVVQELTASEERAPFHWLAYVVMPDHFHWLLQIVSDCSLAKIVGHAKGRSAYRINATVHGHGRVWQAGFHDHALRREERIENAANYIIHNPVRAGLAKDVYDYPFWDTVWHGRYGG